MIIAEIKTTTKRILNIHFEFAYYAFLLIHLELKRRTHGYTSSFVNHTRFQTLIQTKMGKIYTRFQTKTVQKPYPLGRHIPTAVYEPRVFSLYTEKRLKCDANHIRGELL